MRQAMNCSVKFLVALVSIFFGACVSPGSFSTTTLTVDELLINVKAVVKHGDLTDYEFLQKMLHLKVRALAFEPYETSDDKIDGYQQKIDLLSFPKNFSAAGFSYDSRKSKAQKRFESVFTIRLSKEVCVKEPNVAQAFKTSGRYLSPDTTTVRYEYMEGSNLRAEIMFGEVIACAISLTFIQSLN